MKCTIYLDTTMKTGHWRLQKHWVLYLPRDQWKFVNHVLLLRLSRRIQLMIHLVVERVLLTTIKCIWTYLLYVDPTRNVPINMCGISWWTTLQGTVLMDFIRQKATSLNWHANSSRSGEMFETRLKLFAMTMLEKTNFLSSEQEAWIGNWEQNLNIQQEQLPSITVLLNWDLLHAPDCQEWCLMMPIWMLTSELN